MTHKFINDWKKRLGETKAIYFVDSKINNEYVSNPISTKYYKIIECKINDNKVKITYKDIFNHITKTITTSTYNIKTVKF